MTTDTQQRERAIVDALIALRSRLGDDRSYWFNADEDRTRVQLTRLRTPSSDWMPIGEWLAFMARITESGDA